MERKAESEKNSFGFYVLLGQNNALKEIWFKKIDHSDNCEPFGKEQTRHIVGKTTKETV